MHAKAHTLSYGIFTAGAKRYDLTHLDPFTVQVVIHGVPIDVDVSFSFHVFTDQKGIGPRFPHRAEERYFCTERYRLSHAVADFMRCEFFRSSVRRHVRVLSGRPREQFYCTDMGHGDIIWLRISRREQSNRIHVWVASAYNRDRQRQVLPHGHGLYRVQKVLASKLGLLRP